MQKIKAVRRGGKESEDVPRTSQSLCPSSRHTVAAGSCSWAGNIERSHERGGLRPCSGALSPLVNSASPVQLWPVSPMALVVSGLRWIAKLQSCGFLQLAGKFDAGFPYVRSLQGSTARLISPAALPTCCARARALSTPPWGFAFSPFPPAKSCPISYPSAVFQVQGLK